MNNTIVSQGFYKLNNKILKFNISKNKEEILFNHYIMQKENIQRIKNELPKGQFYLTIRTVCNDLEVTYGKARHLINTFEKLDIITLIKAGGKNRTPSIYLYNSFINNDTVNNTVNSTADNSVKHSYINTLENMSNTIYNTVNDTDYNTFEKEILKRNIKNDNISKAIYVSNNIDTIKERWNSLNISRVVSIKGNRLKLLNARIKEYGLGSIYAAIENIKQSDFLKGQNNRNWIINFDWFIRPNNFIKVLEGNYTNRIVKGQQEALQPLERVYEC